MPGGGAKGYSMTEKIVCKIECPACPHGMTAVIVNGKEIPLDGVSRFSFVVDAEQCSLVVEHVVRDLRVEQKPHFKIIPRIEREGSKIVTTYERTEEEGNGCE